MRLGNNGVSTFQWVVSWIWVVSWGVVFGALSAAFITGNDQWLIAMVVAAIIIIGVSGRDWMR